MPLEKDLIKSTSTLCSASPTNNVFAFLPMVEYVREEYSKLLYNTSQIPKNRNSGIPNLRSYILLFQCPCDSLLWTFSTDFWILIVSFGFPRSSTSKPCRKWLSGCTERLWSLPHWRSSKFMWILSWATRFRCFCLSRRDWWPPEGPSNLNYSVILWLWGNILLFRNWMFQGA